MRAPFDKLRPPRPAIELRARVLGAAFAAPSEKPHWIDLLWESRGFRVALAVAFGTAVTAQVLLRDGSAHRVLQPEVIEIDGLNVRVDRFDTNSPIPPEVVQ